MDRKVLEILSVAYSFEKIKRWDCIYQNAMSLYGKFNTKEKETGRKND